MFRVRDAQMKVLRSDRIRRTAAPLMVARLREGGYLDEELAAPEPAADAEPEIDPDLDLDADTPAADAADPLAPLAPITPITPEPPLETIVAREIERALDDGIESDAGVLQYVSYRFLLHPGWQDDPRVRAKLVELGAAGEEARLAWIHHLVTRL